MSEAKASYRAMSEKLDAILAALQDEATDVDKATKLYEEGNILIQKMQEYLDKAENSIVREPTKVKQKRG
jgi:exodeoxyribonuclease VII small subunit